MRSHLYLLQAPEALEISTGLEKQGALGGTLRLSGELQRGTHPAGPFLREPRPARMCGMYSPATAAMSPRERAVG